MALLNMVLRLLRNNKGFALITKTNTFTAGATILAAEHNTNFDTIYNDYNGNITTANVSASAAIAFSKLSLSDDVTVTGDWAISNAATTDTILSITGNSLTTGLGVLITSNSANTGERKLLSIINDNTAATAASCISIQNDASSACIAIDANGSGPHLSFTGDSNVSNPLDGDIWYNGSQIYFYDGTTTTDLLSKVGHSVQVVNAIETAVSTGTRNSFDDDSIPQAGEGNYMVAATITPTSATNELKIDVIVNCDADNNGMVNVGLFQDNTAGALAACQQYYSSADKLQIITLTHYMTAGTAVATKFRVEAGHSANNITRNGENGSRKLGGSINTTITITEIGA